MSTMTTATMLTLPGINSLMAMTPPQTPTPPRAELAYPTRSVQKQEWGLPPIAHLFRDISLVVSQSPLANVYTPVPSPTSTSNHITWDAVAHRRGSAPEHWPGVYSPPASCRGDSPTAPRRGSAPVRTVKQHKARVAPYPSGKQQKSELQKAQAAGYSDVPSGGGKKKPRGNEKYLDEQLAFIVYHKVDLGASWESILEAYVREWPVELGNPKRDKPGLECIYYRTNTRLPEMIDKKDKLLVLDAPPFETKKPDPDLGLKEGKDYFQYVVRDNVPYRCESVHCRSEARSLADRFPEDVANGRYPWVRPEHQEEVADLAWRRRMQRLDWLRTYGTNPDGTLCWQEDGKILYKYITQPEAEPDLTQGPLVFRSRL
ncbi:hypothetical protein QBC35DRAFT_187488 [Podospora australis]|uniref:Uncharacterized protein n=1 Tax=Podospora australis TaxID=1536484 RepID=A0AAN6WY77_9PEZI|nr:hypothetical protein QBC35DRAFT_187488 [Podospora australis]